MSYVVCRSSYGGPFVGYGGGWGTAVMRPTPGYLSEWQYGYPGAVPGYAPYNAPYYNGYAGPPPAHHQQVGTSGPWPPAPGPPRGL